MRIKFVVKGNNGCDWHRLYVPLDNIHFDSQDKVLMGVYGETEFPRDCDIYMFNRTIKMSPAELDRRRKEKGFKVVVDVDDYWVLPPSHYLYHIWNSNDYAREMTDFISMADLVTTTTERLKEKILPFNPNVIVYPNAMAFPGIPAEKSDKLRFLYAGGITHEHDIALLTRPFQRVDDFIRRKAEFVLCGFDDKHPSPTWNKMAKVFKSTDSYSIYGPLPVTEYMSHYDHADVAIIPLVDNTFNAHKSPLKIIEAATKGIPCIVSKVPPYSDLGDIPGVLWVEHSSDWLKHIRFCIKNPQWVTEAGSALQAHMSQHFNIVDWAAKRYEDLKTLL